jgi:polyphosphate kinase
VDEQRDEDFIEAMEDVLEGRETSMVVRMSYSAGSNKLRDYLASRLGLEEGDLYEIDGPLNLGSLHDLVQIRGFDHLREKPWKIYDNPAFPEDAPLWDRIREGDVLLHLPYQSFDPVLRFFRDAVTDPQVISIKTTLYRTSDNSPIIRALEQASLAGKHVTAVVELKARFNEKQNISWANRLEKAGVIVVYGLARLKIHAKAAMVIRRENEKLKRYVHLSTGNYNESTAKVYEDISLFTAREDIAYDTGLFFNTITGYSVIQSMRRMAIAPLTLKGRLLYLIEREINQQNSETPGLIIAKMNSLADVDIINALYRASQAGVEILLIVRGICLLIPDIPGMSEHIQVISIIDHYLEHSRICYFANGGNEELYLSSADWMPRNLERRAELMFPILEEDSKQFILEILQNYFQDNTHAWFLDTGSWFRINGTGEEPFRAQTRFLAMADKSASRISGESLRRDSTGFIIRRKPPAQA